MDNDREKLEARDMSPARYLAQVAEILLSGPDIVEFKSW